jgi:glyoxylase-like metal-dependent hydrolase (beta-lactamase superfamily II)
MHPRYLSNAFIVGESRAGVGVMVDSGAPIAPLLQFSTTQHLRLTHVLRTHSHADHTEHEDELGLPVMTDSFTTGGLEIEAIPTPGHSDDMVCFVIKDPIGDELVVSGDTLFKDSVGGGDFELVKKAVMETYMKMPHDRRVLPGHSDLTTIGREWEYNPFIRVWRGVDPEGTERVTIGEREATLIVWSPDYDGKGKAWVRYDDGEDAVVGGSTVEREGDADGDDAA